MSETGTGRCARCGGDLLTEAATGRVVCPAGCEQPEDIAVRERIDEALNGWRSNGGSDQSSDHVAALLTEWTRVAWRATRAASGPVRHVSSTYGTVSVLAHGYTVRPLGCGATRTQRLVEVVLALLWAGVPFPELRLGVEGPGGVRRLDVAWAPAGARERRRDEAALSVCRASAPGGVRPRPAPGVPLLGPGVEVDDHAVLAAVAEVTLPPGLALGVDLAAGPDRAVVQVRGADGQTIGESEIGRGAVGWLPGEVDPLEMTRDEAHAEIRRLRRVVPADGLLLNLVYGERDEARGVLRAAARRGDPGAREYFERLGLDWAADPDGRAPAAAPGMSRGESVELEEVLAPFAGYLGALDDGLPDGDGVASVVRGGGTAWIRVGDIRRLVAGVRAAESRVHELVATAEDVRATADVYHAGLQGRAGLERADLFVAYRERRLRWFQVARLGGFAAGAAPAGGEDTRR